MKIAALFGTRPEAIKMAPVVHSLRCREASWPGLRSAVYVTGQHRELLDQVLRLFDVRPDEDLTAMRPGQSLPDLTARLVTSVSELLGREKPDLVLVHGDTTTAFAGALAAYYNRIPVGHVEAGLRTRDRYNPFPEEMNRQLVGSLATYHFAPTAEAVSNLLSENVDPSRIVQTGNTVIDALLLTLRKLGEHGPAALAGKYPALGAALAGDRRLLLVTSHRRENLGDGLAGICGALVELSKAFDDVEIVFPVHPNPQVRASAEKLLSGRPRIHLLPPLEYDHFCCLMSRSHLILTDSGGIQEEAPALGKPVLVLRDTSERPEAVRIGAAQVVGVCQNRIVQSASRLLSDQAAYQRMARAGSPYGDGRASERIVDFLRSVAPSGRAVA